MNKREAIRAMCDGKKVRRESWKDGEFLQMDENGQIFDEDGFADDINEHDDDNDWQIYEEPKPKVTYDEAVAAKEQNPMTQQFNTITDALKWCIDNPGQRCRDEDGREIWFQLLHEGLSLFQTNINFLGQASRCENALTPEEMAWLDLSTLRPVEVEPEKPTLGNLTALEHWDKITITYPDGPEDHYRAQNGTWAYHYPQLKLALELGWPVEFGRNEK